MLTDFKQYGALALAYMGDAVYELAVREYLMKKANMPVNTLHRYAKKYVSAVSQSRFFDVLAPSLTEEETAVYRRGRNSKPHTAAKNASLADYKKATGLEALFGYLYLTEKHDRISELLDIIFENGEI